MASASSVLQAPSTHALVLCGAQLQLWGPAVVLVAVVSPSGMQTGQIPQERVQNPFRCHLFWAAQPLALCKSHVSLFALLGEWPLCTCLPHCWIVWAEEDHLMYLSG